jgi:hypothetical protein
MQETSGYRVAAHRSVNDFSETFMKNKLQLFTQSILIRETWAVSFIAFLIVGWLLAFAPGYRWTPTVETAGPFGNDFLQEWVGGRMILSGDAKQLYDPITFDQRQHDEKLVGFQWKRDAYFPPVYPPPHYTLATAIAWIPYRIAVTTWLIILSICLVAAFTLSRKLSGLIVDNGLHKERLHSCHPRASDLSHEKVESGLKGCGPTGQLHTRSSNTAAPIEDNPIATETSAISDSVELKTGRISPTFDQLFQHILPLAAFFPPVFYSLLMGQKGTWWMFLVSLSWFLFTVGKDFRSGLIFGLMSVKPTLFFLLPLVLLRNGEKRFFMGASITTAIIWGGSFLVLPFEVWKGFASQLAMTGSYASIQGYHLEWSCNLLALSQTAGPGDVAWLKWTVVFPLAIYAVYSCFHDRINDWTSPFVWMKLLVATMLLSPHTYFYDLAILAVPIIGLSRLAPIRSGTYVSLLTFGVVFAEDCGKLTGLPILAVLLTAILVELQVAPRLLANRFKLEIGRYVQRPMCG